jgi:predicted phosphoribosyltransferase
VRRYRDRAHAGDVLAESLAGYRGRPEVIVLGLVRGGVPVAERVARALSAPIDVLVVRKLGVPGQPEVAFGALGPGGVQVLSPIAARLAPDDMDRVVAAESVELARREARYRAGRPPLELTGRTAILVDDGLATGATAQAAVTAARRLGAERVVLAAPVGAADALSWLAGSADEVVCPLAPADFGAVSAFYQRFEQVTEGQVRQCLERAG